MEGKARLDRRTKDLVKRLQRGEIAVIAHQDIDELAASNLIACRPLAIINTCRSLSGTYPARGAMMILKANIPLIDEFPEHIFERVQEGERIWIHHDGAWRGEEWLGAGKELKRMALLTELARAEAKLSSQLETFVDNTLEYAQKEKELLLNHIPAPELQISIRRRPVLIVVRGTSYKEDLRAIHSYIKEQRPVLLGVDGGADALLEFGWTPDIIVGDMDSVSDAALFSGAELLVHAYADGTAPGMGRIEQLGLQAQTFAVPGTSEDVAMLLAWEKGASLIVAVGSHSNMLDFLEKGRKGMASTFLVRLKVGSILVDARGVSQLYRHSLQGRQLLQIMASALVPITIILWVSPLSHSFFQLLWLRLRMLFGG